MLKTRTQIGSAVGKVLFIQLKELSKSTKIPMSRLLDEGIEDLLEKYQKKRTAIPKGTSES